MRDESVVNVSAYNVDAYDQIRLPPSKFSHVEQIMI